MGILLVIKHNMSNKSVDTESYTKQGEGKEGRERGQTVKRNLSQTGKPYIGEASNFRPCDPGVRREFMEQTVVS